MGDNMECYDCCKAMCPNVGTQQLRTLNDKEQIFTKDGIVDLGECVYACGDCIRFEHAEAINIYVPGLYCVYFAGDFKESIFGDTTLIQPLKNGNAIYGSGLYIDNPTALKYYPQSSSFFVSVEDNAVLTFHQSTTSISDLPNVLNIKGFTVTVMRVG